ncbi:MAG: PrpF domain-containing protein [Moraxella osloensis]
MDASKVPQNGICEVRIWQQNISKTIIAHVPMTDGQVQETGDFELDGVTFPAAEVKIEFIDPVDSDGDMFPTGNPGGGGGGGGGKLNVPEIGEFDVTMINAGIPTIFKCQRLGFYGR